MKITKEMALKKFFLLGIAEASGLTPNDDIFEDDIIVISDTQCLWTVQCGPDEYSTSAWVFNNTGIKNPSKMVYLGGDDD